MNETVETKSSEVAFRRSGSDDAELLSPENSDKSMGDAMAEDHGAT